MVSEPHPCSALTRLAAPSPRGGEGESGRYEVPSPHAERGLSQILTPPLRKRRGGWGVRFPHGLRASPPLGAHAPRRPLSTWWRGGKPNAARLGVRLLPASHVSLTTFAHTPRTSCQSSRGSSRFHCQRPRYLAPVFSSCVARTIPKLLGHATCAPTARPPRKQYTTPWAERWSSANRQSVTSKLT